MNHFLIFLKSSNYFHWSIILVCISCISALSSLPSANFGLSLFIFLVPWGIKIGCLSDLIVGLYYFNFPLSTIFLAPAVFFFTLFFSFFYSFTLTTQTIDSDVSLNYDDPRHINLVLYSGTKKTNSYTQVMRGRQVIKNNRMWKNKRTKQKPGARFAGTQKHLPLAPLPLRPPGSTPSSSPSMPPAQAASLSLRPQPHLVIKADFPQEAL